MYPHCSSSLGAMRPLGAILQGVIVLKILWVILTDYQISDTKIPFSTQLEQLY